MTGNTARLSRSTATDFGQRPGRNRSADHDPIAPAQQGHRRERQDGEEEGESCGPSELVVRLADLLTAEVLSGGRSPGDEYVQGHVLAPAVRPYRAHQFQVLEEDVSGVPAGS